MPTAHTVSVWQGAPTNSVLNGLSDGDDLIATSLTLSDVDDNGSLASGDTVGGEAITYIEVIDLNLGVNGATQVLAVQTPSAIYLIPLDGTVPTDEVFVDVNTYTGTTSASIALMCFLEGSLIATETGARRVEHLSIGEAVATADGRYVPITWIGRQTVFTRFGPAERLMPVRFAAGSLGDGLPHTDLMVTADHGMLVDGVICHAGALVNGGTITRVPLSEMGESYTVYHIETEAHEIILANGAPAETFIDNVSRRVFDNFAEFEALYGDVPEMEELPYPRAMSARQVPGIVRQRLQTNQVA